MNEWVKVFWESTEMYFTRSTPQIDCLKVFFQGKKCLLQKGCGELLLHSWCSLRSVITSSSWGIYCVTWMSHIFIKTLLEMMEVVKSADNFIGNPVNTMAFFFFYQQDNHLLYFVGKTTSLSTPFIFLHPTLKMSHTKVGSKRLSSLNICCVVVFKCPRRQSQSQREKLSCSDLCQLHPAEGYQNYVFRTKHL